MSGRWSTPIPRRPRPLPPPASPWTGRCSRRRWSSWAPVPVAPFALPGSQGVADSVAPFCREYRALLLEYHGAVTWGESMEQAHYRLECLEQVATVTLHLRALGCDRVIPPAVVKDLEGLRPAWGIK